MNGKLIVIEGLDGSGKGTQSRLLYNYIKEVTPKVKCISFPDYNQPSSALVKMYLNSELGNNPSDVNAYAASSFFAVDRYASYIKFWRSLYEDGYIIICDRYTTSNAGYQMPKLAREEWDKYLTWSYDYEYNKLGLPKPDMVMYLDMPLYEAQKLMEQRYLGDNSKKDLHEMNNSFLFKCAEAEEYASTQGGWVVINCLENKKLKTMEAINKEIAQVVKGEILYGLGFQSP